MKIAKSVNRLGTEAVYNIFAKTKELSKQGKKIIDLSLGQSDFKSPKHAVDAAIQALNELDSLKASNDSLRLAISNNIRVENKEQQQLLKLLQERNNRLQKICRRLKIYSIGSTVAVVIIILAII